MELLLFSLHVLLASLLTAFILTLAKKWGLVERLQVRGGRMVSHMAHCDFCMSWWLGVLVSVLLALLAQQWRMLLLPFFSTMLARRLL